MRRREARRRCTRSYEFHLLVGRVWSFARCPGGVERSPSMVHYRDCRKSQHRDGDASRPAMSLRAQMSQRVLKLDLTEGLLVCSHPELTSLSKVPPVQSHLPYQ